MSNQRAKKHKSQKKNHNILLRFAHDFGEERERDNFWLWFGCRREFCYAKNAVFSRACHMRTRYQIQAHDRLFPKSKVFFPFWNKKEKKMACGEMMDIEMKRMVLNCFWRRLGVFFLLVV